MTRAMPCVLTDVASSWPCVGGDARWTLEHFKRAHGNLDVVVDDGTREKLRTSMAEYVDAFDAMADRAEAAAAEVRLLPIRPRSRCARRSLRTFPVVTLHPRFPFKV